MTTHRILADDGVSLAVHELGEGPPVVLLHGFLSSARANWFGPRIVQALTAAGHRVIAPDLRGHGQSDAPVAPEAWRPDVLATDAVALVQALGLTDYDLVGYSLGGRTAVRAMVRGLRPRRVVIGGMGESGVMEAGWRADLLEDWVRHGEAAQQPDMGRQVQKLMADQGLKRDAILGVFAAFHPTTEAEIKALEVPALVVMGEDDHDNGSAEVLADWLGGRALRLAGDHGTVVSNPDFTAAMVDFLR